MRPQIFSLAAPTGVSHEKYCVAPGAGALGSATIHGVDGTFEALTSALWRDETMGSSPPVSARTFPSQVCMATPFAKTPPSGSVVSTMPFTLPMSFTPRVHVARFSDLNGAWMNHAYW